MQLLATARVGRLVWHQNALPAVAVTRYVLRDGRVAITVPDSVHSGRLDGAVLAFHVDHLCHESSTGWEVLVIGRAAMLSSHSATAAAGIDTTVVSGTRFMF